MLINSFKNLVAVTFESDYSFKQAEKIKEASKNAVAVAAAPTSKAPVKEEKKVEEKPKEEEAADVDMGGLFGDEY